ncbi:MAG: hypothetical protein EPO19_05615 [Betaproteobacteria bacterium]|nr:MAG: hypothetical protein EPO19_05615 [Betaproteobacteria bacterium]
MRYFTPRRRALPRAHALAPGQQRLGTHLDLRHFAATPVGMRVSAEAKLIRIEGRLLTFRVSAADAIEPIGDGTHERVVITLERFDQRVQKKAAQIHWQTVEKCFPSAKNSLREAISQRETFFNSPELGI